MPSYNNQPLFDAINNGNVEAVASLVNSEEYFLHSHKDNEGNGPYHYASNIVDARTRAKIVSALLQAGVNLDQVNNNNKLPSRIAEFEEIKRKQHRFIGNLSNLLLLHPKDEKRFAISLCVTAAAGIIFGFPTFFAFGFVLVVRSILGTAQKEVDNKKLEQRYIQQLEADLLRDIENNSLTSPKLVEYIEKGVNIRSIGIAQRMSALEYAVKHNILAQVQLLHPYQTDRIRSAIIYAISNNRQQAIFDHLLAQIDDVDFRDYVDFHEFYTPLMYAIVNQRTEMVRSLLAKGADTTSESVQRCLRVGTSEIRRLVENAQKNPVAKTKAQATKESAKPKAPVTPIFEAKRKQAEQQKGKAQQKPAAKPAAKKATKAAAEEAPATRKSLPRAAKK